jgi:tetratricopeptide (TPR) repeat protein
MRMVLTLMMAWIALAQQGVKPPPLVPLDKLTIPKVEEGEGDADQPQAGSLAGNALFGLKDKEGKIKAAIATMENDPGNAELRLAAGRLQDSYLRFLDSIFVYTEGVKQFPKDYRFLRMRGHRLISTRKFSEAVADLEKAAKMVPNSFDVAYYLGLAHYFNGDHAKSAAVLAACEDQIQKPLADKKDLMGGRSCESIGADINWRVPLQYWRYLALRRAGQLAAAKTYLDGHVKGEPTVSSSKPFYDALLFFKGAKEINEMLAGAGEGVRDVLTRSSAAATYLFTEGERAKGCSIWARNAMDQNWDHLGVINAESEYHLNSKAACALYGAAPAPQPPQ